MIHPCVTKNWLKRSLPLIKLLTDPLVPQVILPIVFRRGLAVIDSLRRPGSEIARRLEQDTSGVYAHICASTGQVHECPFKQHGRPLFFVPANLQIVLGSLCIFKHLREVQQ